MKEYFKKHVLKDGTELVIRNLVPGDAAEIAEFSRAVDAQSMFIGRDSRESYLITEETELKKIQDQAINDRFFRIVSEIDGKIIGDCGVKCVRENIRFLHRCNIGLVIDKEYWGLGIGKILMEESIEWAKKNGYEQMELETVTENKRGIALYEKLGFVKTGTILRSMKYADGTYIDSLAMTLIF